MVTEKHYVNTSTLVDYLSYSAVKLLDVYAMLLKVKKIAREKAQIYCVKLMLLKSS
ncbi:hypothetical protein BscR1v2_006440 [Bartonella schoenbuchensis R1]|uniref:Uncharacterized protein n=1 Tax=Bartonella schoenbuchensis (strain DSM 13525 / NCTC 13165 / R1) TaxID=687861 RepID=A0A1S6XPN6_BARSR|nr:hypothetical protein BscR1v2_006440 [Bartonella schoenbuchensis R1]